MPRKVTYTCDTCKDNIEWTVYSVGSLTIKSPSVVFDVYCEPQLDPTYCSMECLGKSLQWWADKYDKEHSN